MAGDLCDMCQTEPYTVSNVIRANGDTTWLCWTCFPFAEVAHLQAIGWLPPDWERPSAEAEPEPEQEAVPADKPARRPRVVKGTEESPAGAADPARLETPATNPDDQRGAGRLESGGRAGTKPGPASPGA